MSRLHWRDVAATLPFAGLALAFRFVPLPPGEGPLTPWSWAAANAIVLFVAFVAHTRCYAVWREGGPRRILANELLARLWFVAFGMIVVGRVSPNGLLLALVALPWALLAWEVHRQDVAKRGYSVRWNLGAWGLYLLGLALMELVAVRL